MASVFRLVQLGLLFLTSMTFLTNVGLEFVGPLAVKEALRKDPKNQLTALQQVAIWRSFYVKARAFFSIQTFATLLGFAYAAYRGPTSLQRTIALGGAATALAAGVFTKAALMPINNQLEALDDIKDDEKAKKEGLPLIAEWEALHPIRIFIFSLSWVASFVLLGLDLHKTRWNGL